MIAIFSTKQKITINNTTTSVIQPAQGGLGLSSYDKGDIIYADGYQSLSKIRISDEGDVLEVKDGIPSWQKIEAAFNVIHNNMIGLQGGTDNERYHLSMAELYDLIHMEEKVRSMNLDGYVSKDQLIIDTIRVGIKGKIPVNTDGYLMPDYSESDQETFTYIAITNCIMKKLMAIVRKAPGIGNDINLKVRVDNVDTILSTSISDLQKTNFDIVDTVNVYTGSVISIEYKTSQYCEAEDLQVMIQIIFQ